MYTVRGQKGEELIIINGCISEERKRSVSISAI
jgi:hypothetical protein